MNSVAHDRSLLQKSGQTIKGAGNSGRLATLPASQSGIDHTIARGQSSTIGFEFSARPDQLRSIEKNLMKLKSARLFEQEIPGDLKRAYRQIKEKY